MGRYSSMVLLVVVVLTAARVVSADDIFEPRRQAASQFKPGDQVEVSRLGGVEQGVVTEIDEFGRVHVVSPRFKNGWPYEPDKVRLLNRKRTGANPGGPLDDDSNPFITDEERQGTYEKRTWADKSGKFQVEATLVRFDDENVVLLREDGKELTVPRARLSDADESLLRQLASGDSPDDAAAPGSDDVELIEVNYAAATPIDLNAVTDWNYVPEPNLSDGSIGRIMLPAKRDFFDQVESLLIPSAESAYVVMVNRRDRDMPPRIYACDLTQRKLVESGDFFSKQIPLDVSPDQKRLVARSDAFGFGKSGTLTLIGLDGFKVQPLYSWIPYGNHKGLGLDVQWAKFVDPEHLLTLNHNGQLILWNVADRVRPVYAAKTGLRTAVTFTASRTVAIIRTEYGIAFIKPLTGEMLGFIEAGEYAPLCSLALRPDGERLALADGGGRIRVWNLLTQELERDFCLANGLHIHSPDNFLAWADNDRLVTKRGDLIDVNRRIRLWRYTDIDAPVFNLGSTVWSVTRGEPNGAPVVWGAKLPHGTAQRVANDLDPDTLLVIRPGCKVSLKLSFPGSAAEKERVKQALTERLVKAGMEVVPQSNIVLTAEIKPGEPQKVEYREFGSLKTSEHTIRVQRLELAYVVDGKSVWAFVNEGWTPHVLEMKRGETVDQALARETKQDPRAFESVFVPSYVASAPEEGGYGSSPWPGS